MQNAQVFMKSGLACVGVNCKGFRRAAHGALDFRNLTKTSKDFAKFPTKLFQYCFFLTIFFAESIRMYPNVSKFVKTGPNKAKITEKLRANVGKLRENVF